MYDVLAGVKVVEVAAWLFAPSCGAVLADWGADVIKVETPTNGGDPYRGFFHTGAVSPTIELANRGKRSVAVDLSTAAGHDVLLRLVADADVFVTSLLSGSRARLGLDLDDIREANPSIIYVRASGYGPRGTDADTPGYDAAVVWARSGFASFLTPPDAPQPTPQPGGIGDCVGGLGGAGAVAAALYKRATTGSPSEVDISLLASGMWMNATILMLEGNAGPEGNPMRWPDRRDVPQPAVQRVQDQGRSLALHGGDPTRSALDQLLRAHRSAGADRRPALCRLRGPHGEQQGAHRHPRRGVRFRDHRSSGGSACGASAVSGP